MYRQSKAIVNACIQAEWLFNTIIEWTLDYDSSDEQIAKLNAIYWKTLDFLRDEGIGGVLINGIFRPTERI